MGAHDASTRRAEPAKDDRTASTRCTAKIKAPGHRTTRALKDYKLADPHGPSPPDGLQIQIVDDQNRAMFDSGSALVKPYMRDILRAIGGALSGVENRISCGGPHRRHALRQQRPRLQQLGTLQPTAPTLRGANWWLGGHARRLSWCGVSGLGVQRSAGAKQPTCTRSTGASASLVLTQRGRRTSSPAHGCKAIPDNHFSDPARPRYC